ncbi:MAG: S8 family serine peptidase [Planctomycetes bacterium]|nr:S8 family serine peptidase [Planctomycetota bacterium]
MLIPAGRAAAALLFLLAPIAAQAHGAPALGWAEANRRAELARWLSLKFAEFDTAGPLPVLPAEWTAAPPAADARGYFVVQLRPPVTEAQKQTLVAAGLELLDYVPNHAFFVRASGAAVQRAVALGLAVWSQPLHPAWRIEPELLQPHAAARYAVLGFQGVKLHELRAQVEATGAAVDEAHDAIDRELLIVRPGPGGLLALAQCADVQWVEREGIAMPRNDTMTWTIQTGVSNSRTIWDRGLHGEGQIIGHMDGRIATTSCYFSDPANAIGPNHRKIVYSSGTGSSDSHGTHTAGTAVGDSFPVNGSTTRRGIAWAARIAHSSNYTTSGWATFAATHRSNGARIHTNSWGNDGTTAYNTHCNAIDLFSWNNEDSLVLFAETNLTTLRNPENAKNLVAVGNTTNGTGTGSVCSGGAGPTADGRRKPDLFAPGCSLNSASTGSCGGTTLTGTSMACPAAAGAAALIRQYFVDGFYPSGAANPDDSHTPSGALLKAVLINTCKDMTGVAGYPSDGEGWGSIVLDESLYFPGDLGRMWVVDARRANGLVAGGSRSFQVDVTSFLRPLEITLAFTDYPGTVNASNPVVDNLDLLVTAPNGTVYRGNVFASGWSATGGTADAKNNVERVAVQLPAAGTWTIQVVGTAVPQGPCGFALCATGMLDGGFALASVASYGSGKPGQNGVPALSATLPYVPSTWTVNVANAYPNWVGLTIWGQNQTAIPFDGGIVWAEPLVLGTFTTSALGQAVLPVAIPPDVTLYGARTYWQAWIPWDPGAAGEGWAASNAIRMTMGN